MIVKSFAIVFILYGVLLYLAVNQKIPAMLFHFIRSILYKIENVSGFLIVIISLYRYFNASDDFDKYLYIALVILSPFFVMKILLKIVDFLLTQLSDRKEKD